VATIHDCSHFEDWFAWIHTTCKIGKPMELWIEGIFPHLQGPHLSLFCLRNEAMPWSANWEKLLSRSNQFPGVANCQLQEACLGMSAQLPSTLEIHANLAFSSVAKACCGQYHGIVFSIVDWIQLFGYHLLSFLLDGYGAPICLWIQHNQAIIQ